MIPAPMTATFFISIDPLLSLPAGFCLLLAVLRRLPTRPSERSPLPEPGRRRWLQRRAPPPLLRSSYIMVMVIRRALAPTGWPMAMAPPFTLVFSRRSFKRRTSSAARIFVLTRGMAAKASLISIRSMSSSFRSAFSSALKMVGAGIAAMYRAFIAVATEERTVARGLTPFSRAFLALISRMAVAPVQRPGDSRG